MVIHPCNFSTPDVNAADYEACHLQTPFKFIQMTPRCQLETHSLHFSLEHLFYDCRHSSTARQGVLIESLMRNYLFIFHKHLPLHSSFPSNSPLWGAPALALSKCWRRSTESWESEVQGRGAVVISHLTVHYMECRSRLSGRRQRHTHTHTYKYTHTTLTIFHFCKGGSCL